MPMESWPTDGLGSAQEFMTEGDFGGAEKGERWTVCEKHPKGSADSAKAILAFWTSDLKSLSK
jgi:hypothetical protein